MLGKKIGFFVCAFSLASASLAPLWGKEHITTPDQAIQSLIEGNKRYVKDQMECEKRMQERREALVGGQTPFAVVLGCSDSRVSPEIIFDQGLGDLFVVRVAGNVMGPDELDSINYAVHIGAVLVVVLGHQDCGAVKAVLTGQTEEIKSVATKISAAIHGKDKDLPDAIHANVRGVVNELKQSPGIKKYMDQKKLDVIGAYYTLGDGHVDLLR